MSINAMPRQRGLSLIELIIFIVIIGIGLAGILQVMNLTTRNSADPLRRKQALLLAEGLLEEVQLARFTYCDPDDPAIETANSAADCATAEEFGLETGDGRPYDNINDYVDSANTPKAAFDFGGKLADANQVAIDVQGYSARVTISPAALGPATASIGAAGGTSANTDVLRITVEVTYDGGRQVVLDAYRARYAPNFK